MASNQPSKNGKTNKQPQADASNGKAPEAFDAEMAAFLLAEDAEAIEAEEQTSVLQMVFDEVRVEKKLTSRGKEQDISWVITGGSGGRKIVQELKSGAYPSLKKHGHTHELAPHKGCNRFRIYFESQTDPKDSFDVNIISIKLRRIKGALEIVEPDLSDTDFLRKFKTQIARESKVFKVDEELIEKEDKAPQTTKPKVPGKLPQIPAETHATSDGAADAALKKMYRGKAG